MGNYTLLPSLDHIVLDTIHLYRNLTNTTQIDLTQFQKPLVVGSGNGYYTGRILFRNIGAFFANESEVEKKIEKIKDITDVVVISASGEKHAPIIIKTAKKFGKKTFLISSSEKSTGRTIVDDSIIMPKAREPYTYNTSTYFGYIFSENPNIDLEDFEDFLTKKIDHLIKDMNFAEYKSFCMVIPDEFVLLSEMFETKFIELFGRKIARDIFSYEQMKHATTVIQDDRELFICFGNTSGIQYGKNQIDLPVFENGSYATMMLLGYYLVGKIQVSFPPYFIDSIEDYTERAFLQSGFKISPMVEI